MASTITDLERLKVALGDQVPLLSNAPYDKIVTTDLVEEPQAVSFKIFLGYTRARRDSSAGNSSEHLEPSMTEIDREKVWVHLYPSQSSKGQPEIQFHAYSRDGSYIAKQDSETINKIISEFAVAFTLPGRRKWSRSKLVALAKYYFLRKMASTNETLQYGVVITKTFKDDLISACRNFAEEAERSNTNAEPATVLAREGESDESLLSEAPHGLLDEPDSSGSTTKKEEPAIQPKVEAAHARVMLTSSNSEEEAIQSLLKLHQDEEEVKDDIVKIKKEIDQLDTKQKAKEEQLADLATQRHAMFQGMSMEAVFSLGRRVERDDTHKRRRLN